MQAAVERHRVSSTNQFIDLSPLEPVDWRWRRAQRQLRGRQRTMSPFDPWLAAAAAFHDELDGGRSRRTALRTCSARVDAVQGAHRLANDFTLLPIELQARVLASQPADSLATWLNVSEAVIVAYEHVFFDARRRLGATSWLQHRVLREHMRLDGSIGDVGGLWLTAALGGGITALELLLTSLPLAIRYVAKIDDYFNPLFGVPPLVQQFVASKCLSAKEAASPAFVHYLEWFNATGGMPSDELERQCPVRGIGNVQCVDTLPSPEVDLVETLTRAA